jgi:YD repeat-containing protein
MEPLEVRKLMSLTAPLPASSSPLTTLRMGNSWVSPYFEGALDPAQTTMENKLQGWSSGFNAPTLLDGTGFGPDPTLAFSWPATLPSSASGSGGPTTTNWSQGGANYQSIDSDSWTLGVTASSSGGSWSFDETYTFNFTVTTNQLVGNSPVQVSYAAGSYSYSMSASGTSQGSNYTFNAVDYCSGSGTYSNASAGTWWQTTDNSDTIANTTPISGSASGSVSGSGQSISSYSGGGYYSASAFGAWVNGSTGGSGSDTSGYSYGVSYAQGASGWASSGVGSGSNYECGSASDYYSGGGAYYNSGSGWSAAGSAAVNGDDGSSYSYDMGYSLASGSAYYGFPASGGDWVPGSGSGGCWGSGDETSSYSGSGPFYPFGTGCASGTFSQSGGDQVSYSYGTTASCAAGSWTQTGSQTQVESGSDQCSYGAVGPYNASGSGWAASGSASQSGAQNDTYGDTTYYNLGSAENWVAGSGFGTSSGGGYNDSWYSGSGTYTDSSGGESTSGTFHENGWDDGTDSYSDAASCTAGSWSYTSGSATEVDSGQDHCSYSGGGTYSDSGTGWSASGSLAESGSQDDSYGSTTYLNLDSSGNWHPATGFGGSSGSGGDYSSYGGTGSYTDSSGGESTSGTFQENGSDNLTYTYNDAVTCTAGSWAYTGGSGTDVEWGGDNYSYSGAGTYSDSGSGWSASGSLGENGSQQDSFSYTSHYGPNAGGNWGPTSGSGGYSEGGGDYFSYCGGGTYSASGQSGVGQVIGTLAESGFSDDSYSDSASSALNSGGNWYTTSAGGSTSGSDADYSSYSGGGSYSRTDSSTYALSGTIQANGYDNDSDNYQATLGQDSSGNWIDVSGSGTSTEQSDGSFSYSGSGGYSSGSPGSDGSWIQSTAGEHGGQDVAHSETDDWGVSGGSWVQTGTAAESDSDSGESYFDYSANGGSQWTNASGVTATTYQEAVNPDTWWNNAGTSGDGTATYDQTQTFTPVSGSGSSSSMDTADNWSQPSAGGVNTVWGSSGTSSYDQTQPEAGFYSGAYYPGHNLGGIGSPPANDAQFGPDYSADGDFSQQCQPAMGTGQLAQDSPLPAGEGPSPMVPGVVAPADSGGSSLTPDPQSPAPSFTHDSAGNLTSLTDPDGNTTTWSYEQLPSPSGGGAGGEGSGPYRVTSETDALGDSSYFAYDTAGNLVRYTDADGRVDVYQYDSQNRLTSETDYADAADADAQENPLDVFQYAYDSSGNLLSASDDTSSDTYAYDGENRLTTATETAAGSPTVVLTYQYNGQSGGLSQVSSDETGTVPFDEPVSVAATIDGVADYQNTYQYNDLGEMVGITQGGQPGGNAVADKEVDFGYNDSGQLSSIQRYLGGQAVAASDYSYDSLGRLTGISDHQGDMVLAGYAYTYGDEVSGVRCQGLLVLLHPSSFRLHPCPPAFSCPSTTRAASTLPGSTKESLPPTKSPA